MHIGTGILMCLFLILLSVAELSYGSNSSLPEEAIVIVTTAASNNEHSVKFSTASSLTKLISSIDDNSAPRTHVPTIGSDNSLLSTGEDVILPSQTMSFGATETIVIPGEEMIWSTELVPREKGIQTDAPISSLSVSSNFPPNDAQVKSSENEISPSIRTTQMSTRSSEVTVMKQSDETEGLMTSGRVSLIVLESLKSASVSPTPVLNEESTALETVPGDYTQDSPSFGVQSSETSHSISGILT